MENGASSGTLAVRELVVDPPNDVRTTIPQPSLQREMIPTQVPHIQALTGLRFLAALLVYISHVSLFPANTPNGVKTFMASGFNGVALFFVLSGFIICYNYYDRFMHRFRASIWPFFVARFARIYPMYLFMLLWFLTLTNLNDQFRLKWSWLLQQITMTQAWNRDIYAAYSYNSVAWSLSAEVFFYLLFPLVVVLILRFLRTIPVLVCFGAGVVVVGLLIATWFNATGNNYFWGDAHWILYRLPATRFGDFLLGCVAARIYMLRQGKPITPTEQRIAMIVLTLATLAVIVVMLMDRPLLVPYRFDTAYSLPFVAIIYTLARYPSAVGRFLRTRPMLLLGEASYSFYLLHAYFLSTLSVSGGRVIVLHSLMVLVIIALLAIAAYTYIEVPSRAFIRRLGQ